MNKEERDVRGRPGIRAVMVEIVVPSAEAGC